MATDLYKLDSIEYQFFCPQVDEYPTILDETKIMRFWFKQDDEFKVPQGFFLLNIVK